MPDNFDLVVIGAGEAGQAAAYAARDRGARVAIVDRELFGGSCPFWACMPSKALLHAAAIHARGGDYAWQRASDFRDWMIVRERPRDWPDDSGHVNDLEAAGAEVIRGNARIAGPGSVVVSSADGDRTLRAKAILIAVGSNATIPDDIAGLDQIRPWTNPGGDLRPRAAQKPCRPGRRADRRRDVAGLRPLRRPDRACLAA